MAKQTIEIDVPEGYEIVNQIINTPKCHVLPVNFILGKKDPEYIEVREFLGRAYDGVVVHYSAQKGISNTKDIEESTSFIRWIDQDWRKVEI